MNLDNTEFKKAINDGNHFFNVGSGEEISIRELAKKISKTVGYNGDLVFDLSMPDGTPRKFLDSSKIKKLGWKPNSIYQRVYKKLIKIT